MLDWPSERAFFRIRLAIEADIPSLQALIETSVRELTRFDYSEVQIAHSLRTVFGVDTQLIADGTYFIAEAPTAPLMAGCGGWSKRRTLFGADHCAGREDALLDPTRDAAKIRAFFVHPAWSRQGLGTQLLLASEKAAHRAGFQRFEMGATLTGVALYRRCGYSTLDKIAIPLGDGLSLPIVRMEKLAAAQTG